MAASRALNASRFGVVLSTMMASLSDKNHAAFLPNGAIMPAACAAD
jgi:hypothetical protein